MRENPTDVDSNPAASGPSRRVWAMYAGGAFVVALVAIVGVGLLLRGGDPAAPGSSANPTYEPTPAPTWNAAPLAGVALPPLRAAQFPGEPPSYVMEDRIWDYVGPGWGLGVFRYNVDLEPRDAAAFQGIYLISPEGYPFFLHILRTDFYLSVVHWEPAERTAWIDRCDDRKKCRTVEFDLVPGDTTEAWVINDGTAEKAVFDAQYLGTLDGGVSLWRGKGSKGGITVMTRPPGGATTVVEGLRPAYLRSSGAAASQFWLDVDQGVAYLRTITKSGGGDSASFDSTWTTIDLITGVETPLSTAPKEPSDSLVFTSHLDLDDELRIYTCASEDVVIDGWLLENCPSGAVPPEDDPGLYLIDPTGVADPITYTGAVPEWPSTWTTAGASDFGLPTDSGWAVIIRALLPTPTLALSSSTPLMIAAGGRHSCVVNREGTVSCWGGDHFDHRRDMKLTDVVEIAIGRDRTCAVHGDGTVSCWGPNGTGQLGDGTTTDRSSAVAAVGVTDAVGIAAGGSHTCAVHGDGAVSCWGDNSFGQLGDGTTFDRPSAVTVVGLTGVMEIAAGGDHSCALHGDGTVSCWGGIFREGGGGWLTDVVEITAGKYHSCALHGNGTVSCWGANYSGQLGDGTTTELWSRVRVVGLTDAVEISGGEGHTCARHGDGTVSCWGDNSFGQLGDGTTTDSSTPVHVVGLTDAVEISGSDGRSCARRGDGTVYCWGSSELWWAL